MKIKALRHQCLLTALFGFLINVSVMGDSITVDEFEAGTTISSSAMNDNFQTLVDESNQNDARISSLETFEDSVAPVPTWVDANGQVIGYGPGNHQNSVKEIFVKLPETDLIIGPVYHFTSATNTQYGGDGVLSFSGSDCTGDAVLWTAVENGDISSAFGVDLNGKYVYPGEPSEFNFLRGSYVMVESQTGSLSCRQDNREIYPVSEALTSSKDYVAPLAEPVVRRWR